MKNILFFLFSMLFTLASGSNPNQKEWKKVKRQQWPGQNSTWYKLNEDNYRLMESPDGKKWEESKTKKWQDKGGDWFMMKGRRLLWSANGTTGWATVPESQWQAPDGKWYKFDKWRVLYYLEEASGKK
jgi:hypothetical protein